jgi:ABC-type maltose transport system permease subunit
MKLSSREIKIAERLFLAYSYRQYVSKKNKMIVVFNYFHYPVLFAFNNGNNTFTLIKTLPDKKSFDKFDDLLTFEGDFQKYLRSMFSQYPFNIKNYKVAIWNFILDDNLIDKNEEILMDKSSEKTCTLEEAK